MSQSARIARMHAYADAEQAKIWSRPTLRQMIERAAMAQDQWQAVVADAGAVPDDQFTHAERMAINARTALLDHLFEEHGVSRALAAKLGDVL